MLQQILDTGYIDPELKEQLTEEQQEVDNIQYLARFDRKC